MKIITLLIVCTFLIAGVALACPYTFKQYEDINYRFRCIDEDNNYCTSTTILSISVEDPVGTNAMDNVSMTYNPTYFNVTLPTSVLGESYQAIIVSPTTNGTISEFCYDITPTGSSIGNAGTIVFVIFISLSIIILLLSLVFHNYIFAFISGLSFGITGVYSMIYGFTTTLTTYTRMISLIVIGFGLIITVISALELMKETNGEETSSFGEEEE